MKKLLYILLLLVFSFPVFAAEYYVKTGGNDSLDGLSDGNAWETISKVTATATNGDTVYFRSQDTWEDTTPPVLEAATGVTYDGSTYGSGTRAKFHATGDAATNRIGVVNLYASNITFTGFEVTGASGEPNDAWQVGGIYIGLNATADTSNITVDNCVIHEIGGEEGPNRTPVTGTYYLYGIIVGGSNYKTVSDVTIINTQVYNVGHEGISIYPSRGIAAGPTYNIVDTVLVRNCLVHDTAYWGGTTWGHGIDVGLNTVDVTIEFSTVYNASGGLAIVTYADDPSPGSPDNTHVRYNLIYDSGSGIAISPSTGPGFIGDNYIYGNIFINNGISINAGDYNSTVQAFYNNTVFRTDDAGYALNLANGLTEDSNIEVKNNIFYTNDYVVVKNQAAGDNLITHEYNLYFRASGTGDTYILNPYNVAFDGGEVTDYEASAQSTNPNFTGGTLPTGFSGTYGTDMIPNQTYFVISSGNAIDNGATLGSPYNGSINGAGLSSPIVRPQGSAYDIGAYEYDPSELSVSIKAGNTGAIKSGNTGSFGN